MVSHHIGKPFAPQHIDRTLHRRPIPDRCLKAYAKSICVAEVLKLAMTEVTSLLVALLCMMGQVAGMPRYSCGVDARPHIDGICGAQLRRARDNLCFLLYADYPDHFGKRSVNEIFSYPTEAFTKVNLLRDDEVTETPVEDKESKPYLPLLTKISSTAKLPINIKRAQDMSHIQKRGMVCDCCFNRCRPSQLARYC